VFGEGGGARNTFLDKQLIIHRFAQAGSDGTSIKTLPKFTSTKKGLLVSTIISFIDRPEARPGDLQKMRVDVEYQTIDDFYLPSHLKLTDQEFVEGFNLRMDGCKIMLKQSNPRGGVKAQLDEERRPGPSEKGFSHLPSL
jgi:hypothetical protein